jgi:hypothetical protein
MQDFRQFDYVIDFDGIIKAIQAGQQINVIINGEFYDVVASKENTENQEKKEG